MLLGVDVGGTHTDAVVLKGNKVIAQAKVTTDSKALLTSIARVLAMVLEDINPVEIKRLNLSTTLSTNALVEKQTEEVAVIVSAGPGMAPESFRMGDHYFPVAGAVDHRGVEVARMNDSEIKSVASQCARANLRCAAVISKFSTRSQKHEEEMGRIFSPHMEHITLGHRLSGHLNFPRRIATAYYNASVWRLFNKFADAVEESVLKSGITAPINILKADGGTIPLELARNLPVESILSGPAASVMGTIALCKIENDALILDVGGTTTDIAVFADASPIIEEDGACFANHHTLVRAIKTLSVGIGGDSAINILRDPETGANYVTVGPERLGPCMALGGEHPSLMDAFNTVHASGLGDIAASKKGLANLALQYDMPPKMLAEKAIEYASLQITRAVDRLLMDINSRPVYTIRELLGKRKIEPTQVFMIGGPAEVFKQYLSKALKQKVELPPRFSVANAIGAALARNTAELELFADTQQGKLLIPTLGIERSVPKEYTLEAAKKDAFSAMQGYLNSQGIKNDASIDIIEAYSFNMVGESGLSGRNIRVKCQVRPGLQPEM